MILTNDSKNQIFNLTLSINFVPQTLEKTFKRSVQAKQIWAIKILNFMRHSVNDKILWKSMFSG